MLPSSKVSTDASLAEGGSCAAYAGRIILLTACDEATTALRQPVIFDAHLAP